MNIENIVNQYLPPLKKLLTLSRLQHSLDVMKVMAELTPIYSLDFVQATTTGFLHDIAKDLSNEQQMAVIKEAKIEFDYPCEQHPVYLHSLTGAYLATKEVGIMDDMILGAISAHSYAGKKQNLNSPLSQCLRFADLLAPIQEWKGMKKFGTVVYAKQTEEAALLQCGWLIEYFQGQQIPVHPNIEEEYKILSNKVHVTDSFFDRW